MSIRVPDSARLAFPRGVAPLARGASDRRGAWRRRLGPVVGLVGGLLVVATGAALASPTSPTSDASTSAEPVTATRLQHQRVLSYPAEHVWPTSLRYLRVDRGYAVIDRDREAGFILFDFPIGTDPEAPQGRGSLELVTTLDDAGRPAVRLQVSTDAGPVHLPHAIAEGLAAKLRAERGPPAPPPRPEPPPAPPEDPGPWAPMPEASSDGGGS